LRVTVRPSSRWIVLVTVRHFCPTATPKSCELGSRASTYGGSIRCAAIRRLGD